MIVPPRKRGSRPTILLLMGVSGVGKTTTTVNLAAGLAKIGQRVLMVDLDPQGNATMGSGVDKREIKLSIYDVLLESATVTEARIRAEKCGYDVLGANRELAGAEVELVDVERREARLKAALAAVAQRAEEAGREAPRAVARRADDHGVVAPSGAPVPGPAVSWKGRRHGPRQDRRWANAWSPEQISRRLKIDFPDMTVPLLEGSATLPGLSGSASARDRTLTVTLTNPSLQDGVVTRIRLTGGARLREGRATVLTHEDMHATNTFERPSEVSLV